MIWLLIASFFGLGMVAWKRPEQARCPEFDSALRGFIAALFALGLSGVKLRSAMMHQSRDGMGMAGWIEIFGWIALAFGIYHLFKMMIQERGE